MARTAEETVPIEELSFKVLRVPWEQATAQTAAAAVERFFKQERPALAGVLEVSAGQGVVTLRARGEAPQEMLHEALALVRRWDLEEVASAIEVDPAEFGIEVKETAAQPGQSERELLSSEVRYFPYPECEWFEMRDGRLTLTERRIVFEPDLIITESLDAESSARHLIPLDEVERAYRGEWWIVPCLMVQTPRITYRYGWPSERGELELIFDVDEWLGYLRPLLAEKK